MKYRTALEIEYEILKTINSHKEINIKTLMYYVHMTDSTKLHKYLDPLIKLEFVDLSNYKNNRMDGDHRLKILKITEKGKQHLSIIEMYKASISKHE